MQAKGHRFPPDEIDDRFINWKTGVWIDDFITFIDTCEYEEKHDRLGARCYNNLVGRIRDAACSRHILGDCFPEIG